LRRALFATALLALAGCPAAHEGFPTTACKTTADCYVGETCSNLICVPADMSANGGGDMAHAAGADLSTPPDLTTVDLSGADQ
jgi:hypothetical protein